jgi:hypothetical protein
VPAQAVAGKPNVFIGLGPTRDANGRCDRRRLYIFSVRYAATNKSFHVFIQWLDLLPGCIFFVCTPRAAGMPAPAIKIGKNYLINKNNQIYLFIRPD